jgi:phage shock protein A
VNRLLIYVMVAAGLAGCAMRPAPDRVPTPPPVPMEVVEETPEPVPAPRRQASETEVLVSYFERVRKLPAVELAKEYETARLAFAKSRAETDRVRLAVIHAVPGTPLSDDIKALELLEPLVKLPGHEVYGFAYLLAAFVQEQRKLAVAGAAAQQNVQGLQQSVQSLQQNVQALQQKLDALKSLDRNLLEREQAGARKR